MYILSLWGYKYKVNLPPEIRDKNSNCSNEIYFKLQFYSFAQAFRVYIAHLKIDWYVTKKYERRVTAATLEDSRLSSLRIHVKKDKLELQKNVKPCILPSQTLSFLYCKKYLYILALLSICSGRFAAKSATLLTKSYLIRQDNGDQSCRWRHKPSSMHHIGRK